MMTAPEEAVTARRLNKIPQQQNEERFLHLLRARSGVYREAAQLQVAQLILAVLLPVVGAVAGLIWPTLRPWVGMVSLIIAVLDTGWLDRSQRRKIRDAAKIAEEFDCELLDMPWNKLVAGKHLDPEQMNAAALACRKGDDKLRDWYPTEVGNVPLPLARAMCQRTNAWYDATLRQHYGTLLLAIVGVAFIIFLIAAFALKLSVPDLTATVFSPAAPALIWCLREHFRQQDIVELGKTTQAEAENLCEVAVSCEYNEPECMGTARELQNAIYARRATSSLLFPLIYSFRRSRMEKLMKGGAAEFLRKLQSKR